MWLVEERRGSEWAPASRPLDGIEAQLAVRCLRFVRPWCTYRLTRLLPPAPDTERDAASAPRSLS